MNKSILFIALWVLVSCDSTHKSEEIKPKLTTITELVYASVLVKPTHSYFPQPLSSGIIKKIYIEEGDIIQQGQPLVLISNTSDITNRLTTAEINLKEATDNYQGSNNRIRNIELELQSVKEQLTLDSLRYHRQKNLWTQNIGKKNDLEQFELAYKVTQKRVELLEQQKVQTQSELENKYRRAVSQVTAEQTHLDDFTLRSSMDGIVYTVNKKEGELISSQERFAEIGTSDNFVIEMDIDEEDVIKIKIGDSVAVTLNAFANEVFMARVSKVYPKKDETTQTFRVESEFLDHPSKLYNGLSGEANIVIGKKTNALVIPSEYLMAGDKVLTDKGEQGVKTGMKNMNFVEIISGIDTTSVLVKPQK